MTQAEAELRRQALLDAAKLHHRDLRPTDVIITAHNIKALPVTPAKAGSRVTVKALEPWLPAFAGMTNNY